MTLPSMKFKFTNTENSDGLQELVSSKFQLLEKHIGEAPSLCEVEFEKTTHANSGSIYRIEVNLETNGRFFRAESTADSFENAVDEVLNEMDKELRRSNDKKDTMLKKGGRKLKEMLRFGR